MRAADEGKIQKTKGGAMSNQNNGTETPIIVGASGSVGILPDGVFAKILSGPNPEPHQPESPRSEEPRDDC
jgi:hypothetical protein